MTHSTLSFFEYSFLPFSLVCATVTVRAITKKSARINWIVFLSIGLDIILMCAFAAFIYGVSVYNHFSYSNYSDSVLVISTFISFIMFIFAIILAVLIRHWGEYSRTSFWVQNFIGIACLVFLLWIVSKGNNLFSENKKNENFELKSDSDSTQIK